jgi:flagellar FliL protein
MALTETDQQAASKSPSIAVQLGMLAAMTAAAVGIGWLAGGYLKRSETPPSPPPAQADHEADKAELAPEESAVTEGPVLVDLAPITTNLAAPADVWVRMDASILFERPQSLEMKEAIHQDILAFMRTVKLHQVEGASGYQHLKADLRERAAIRSGGQAKDVLIRTLLFE